ncbi:hypothetical protein VCHC33A2_2001, partial [Vibrio cholerae HC-33A2]
MHDRAIGITGF